MNTGAPKLLRLIGRYVGYHPAVIEQVRRYHATQPIRKRPKTPLMIEKCAVKVQVLEALSISDCPAAIIEVLPLLVVGAAQDEVRHTRLFTWVNHDGRGVGIGQGVPLGVFRVGQRHVRQIGVCIEMSSSL